MKSGRNWDKIGTKLGQNRDKIGTKSGQNRDKIEKEINKTKKDAKTKTEA